MSDIGATPLASFGWLVELDQALSADPTVREELNALYLRDGLLVIRGLSLTMDQQRDFCRAFGPVTDSPFENYYVSNVRPDGHLGTQEFQWHNDVAYLPAPWLAAALHAIEVSPGVSSTRFVSAMRAYDRLPAALRERVRAMNGLHVRPHHSDRSNGLADCKPGDMCTVHAVVRGQERTGRPYLYVNQNSTACVIGLDDAASDALLAELFGYLYDDAEVYEHVWQPGDLVLWDNLAVQHARGQLSSAPRTLQRVSLTRLTYAEQYPSDNIGMELANQSLLKQPA